MQKVLLHICCGVCASSPVEKLRKDGFHVTGYFYNPNIYPQEEYIKRLEWARNVAFVLEYELVEGKYDSSYWLEGVKGGEPEPEGGKRCCSCFELRLRETWRKAKELCIDYFTTTLTISPHKDSTAINCIGKSISQSSFLKYDFKKEEGFKKAIDFAKERRLYRQNYCGCIFSRNPSSSRK
jgi:predicted adenine nucleotide alpha hydrolase (AANH) superfamily ATPase